MKYNIPAVAICDHCGKTGQGFLTCIAAGDIRRENLTVPEGWVTDVVKPTIAPVPGRQVQVDLSGNPYQVASLTGRQVIGAWCSTECKALSAGHETMRSLLVPG